MRLFSGSTIQYTCVADTKVTPHVVSPPQSHRAKGLLDLKQCRVYAVHPSLYGR